MKLSTIKSRLGIKPTKRAESWRRFLASDRSPPAPWIATIGHAKNFHNGRRLAAWLGLVPRQHSSGGKQTLLGVSKRGDAYLRTLLIHGARAVMRVAERKVTHADSWLGGIMRRRHHNVAAIALANKNARIVWALLAYKRTYDAHHRTATA